MGKREGRREKGEGRRGKIPFLTNRCETSPFSLPPYPFSF
jgi:hypothetical protein